MQGAIAQVRPRPPRKRWASPGLREEARQAGPAGSRQCLRPGTLRPSLPRLSLRCRCARLLVGGRFSATLCRRSPTPGMGAAATVGPRAGALARVGESGAPGPLYPEHPRAGNGAHCRHSHAFLGPFATVTPSHSWDKGRGRIPTRDLPRTAHAPSPHSGGGALLARTSAGGMGRWDRGTPAGWTPRPTRGS